MSTKFLIAPWPDQYLVIFCCCGVVVIFHLLIVCMSLVTAFVWDYSTEVLKYNFMCCCNSFFVCCRSCSPWRTVFGLSCLSQIFSRPCIQRLLRERSLVSLTACVVSQKHLGQTMWKCYLISCSQCCQKLSKYFVGYTHWENVMIYACLTFSAEPEPFIFFFFSSQICTTIMKKLWLWFWKYSLWWPTGKSATWAQ